MKKLFYFVIFLIMAAFTIVAGTLMYLFLYADQNTWNLFGRFVWRRAIKETMRVTGGFPVVTSVSLKGDYLYIAPYDKVLVFNLQEPQKTVLVRSIKFDSIVDWMSWDGDTLYVVCGMAKLHVFDISQPGNPRRVGKLLMSKKTAVFNGVVKRGIIYFSDEKGLLVVDVANRRHPRLIKYIQMGETGGLFISDAYLYVSTADALSIFNITEPENPIRVSRVPYFMAKGAFPYTPAPETMVVAGKYAYVPLGYEGLGIIDVNNPESPLFVKKIKTGGWCASVYGLREQLIVWLRPKTLLFFNISDPVNPKHVKSMTGIGFPSGRHTENKAVFARNFSEFYVLDFADMSSPKVSGSYSLQHKPEARAVRAHEGRVFLARGVDGLQIYTLSETGLPRLAGSLITSGAAASVELSGRYAYVANGLMGIDVIDVQNPEKPVLKSAFNVEQFTWDVAVERNFLYAATGGTLGIFDIENPLKPRFLSTMTSAPPWLQGISFVSVKYPFAFVDEHVGGGVGIVDISNPNKSFYFKGLHAPALDVAFKGKFVYAAGLYFGVETFFVGGNQHIHLVNNHRTAGFFIGFHKDGVPIGLTIGGGMVLAVDIEGNRLFAADYKNGVFVFDITDPMNLKKVTRYRTEGHPRDIDCEGNYCYVADSEAGLATIDLTSGQIAYVEK